MCCIIFRSIWLFSSIMWLPLWTSFLSLEISIPFLCCLVLILWTSVCIHVHCSSLKCPPASCSWCKCAPSSSSSPLSSPSYHHARYTLGNTHNHQKPPRSPPPKTPLQHHHSKHHESPQPKLHERNNTKESGCSTGEERMSRIRELEQHEVPAQTELQAQNYEIQIQPYEMFTFLHCCNSRHQWEHRRAAEPPGKMDVVCIWDG